MVNYWRNFKPGPDPPNQVYVVTEITRGSRNKYEYDAINGIFTLNRVLYTYFPCDYGFIPQTLDDDGDPLDTVLLINEPTFTGCFTVARPVANIKMIDEGEMDDKIVTVSTTDPFYKHITGMEDLPKSAIDELTYFFDNYKRAEGKTTSVEKWENDLKAKEIIEWSSDYYHETIDEL
ncbi:MAG: inorganic diphosphatase [Candidatus Bathyarchaeia archaeon]